MSKKKSAKELEVAAQYKRLRDTITYHPVTGEFTAVDSTTRRTMGQRIGTLREDGSYIVSFESRLYTASRLAYFWMSGKWPSRPVRLKVKKRRIEDYRWANLELTPESLTQSPA